MDPHGVPLKRPKDRHHHGQLNRPRRGPGRRKHNGGLWESRNRISATQRLALIDKCSAGWGQELSCRIQGKRSLLAADHNRIGHNIPVSPVRDKGRSTCMIAKIQRKNCKERDEQRRRWNDEAVAPSFVQALPPRRLLKAKTGLESHFRPTASESTCTESVVVHSVVGGLCTAGWDVSRR